MFGKGGKEDLLQARLQALNARRGAAPAAPAPAAAPEPRAAAPVATIGPKRNETNLEEAKLIVGPAIAAAIDATAARSKSRGELARMVDEVVRATLEEKKVTLSALTQRDLITSILNSFAERSPAPAAAAPAPTAPQHAAPSAPAQPAPRTGQVSASRASIELAIPKIYPLVMERIDTEVASKLQRPELARQLQSVVGEILDRAEDPAQSARAARPRHRAARRHARPRPARAAARRRDGHRHHGQRAEAGLRRAQGQARADRRHVPRQRARDDRSRRASSPRIGRRIDEIDTAGRRAPRRRQPRQHHRRRRSRSTAPRSRSANSPRRRSHSTSMAQAAEHLAGDGGGAEDRRRAPASTS